MIYHITPERLRSELSSPGHKMTPEMAGENSRQQIDRAGQREDPGRQKVQTPPPAILVEYVVGPARADRRSRILEEGNALFPAAMSMVSADGQFDQRRCQIVSHLAPVEPRVGHKNHDAGEGKRHEAHGHDTVR